MGKPHRSEAQPPAATCAECDRLIESATKILAEVPSDFLPAKQQAEMLKKNSEKAARQCRRAIESNPTGFDASQAHHTLGRALERLGDAGGAAASFAKAGRADGSACEVATAPAASEAPAEAEVGQAAAAEETGAGSAPARAAGKKKKKKKDKERRGGEDDETLDEEALLTMAMVQNAALRDSGEAPAIELEPHEPVEAGAASSMAPKSSDSAAASTHGVSEDEPRYRWMDPLPDTHAAALTEAGVLAGALLTETDLVAMGPEGGVAAAVDCGLIEVIP